MKGDVSVEFKAKSIVVMKVTGGQEMIVDSELAKDVSYISRRSGLSTFMNEYNSQFKTKKDSGSQASTINLPQVNSKDQDISASGQALSGTGEETEIRSDRKSIRVLLKGL